MAEWVIMNILVASHKYNTLREWQLEHVWDESGGGKALFATMSSAVESVLEFLVGRQVANIAQSMGMEILAYTANSRKSQESRHYKGYGVPGTGDPEGRIPTQWFYGTDKRSLHEFLAQGMDYLLVSLPLTKITGNLLGLEEFDILSKRNTFVINISRGDILEHNSLIKALHAYHDDSLSIHGQGRKGLSGAALDVAVPEPLSKEHSLWDAPNCIISPHISGISSEYGLHAFIVLETNLHRIAEGRKLLNQIDRDTGYSSAVAKI
ncbi:D-2-hydroxyacid dehydrogenase [Lachnellula arida]|uniref:D-2-hydroxyacid dehydrogenase n=1 Tax=Lachnellula arida TaxID=1316785 RepID=A0A8T9BND9_9HELO|nr:D-2-hydroxyacid dehydrogenase [Lachnellula arida]